MTKGELIYAIISAVNGGESSPEVPVRNFDVEAVLPTIISTAERLIEIEDVRSYRFDRKSFNSKPSKVLESQTFTTYADTNGVSIIDVSFSNRSEAEVLVYIGEHTIPIYENFPQTLTAPAIRKGYKYIESGSKHIKLLNISESTNLVVNYEHDFSDLEEDSELAYSDILLGKVLELGVMWFKQSRLFPNDRLNNNVDDIENMNNG